MSEDNYLYLQELALLYSLERLSAFVDRFILKHFSMLSFTPDFLRDIPFHKLNSYLSSGQVRRSHHGSADELKSKARLAF